MRPIAHPISSVPALGLSPRGVATVATILLATTAGAVTFAVVEDGSSSGTPSPALSAPGPSSVRYDGGPNEGVAFQKSGQPGALAHRGGYSTAVQGQGSQPVRPEEGVAARSISR